VPTDERDDLGGGGETILASARRNIAIHGYSITYVFGDEVDVPFCYSVGLWETWSHPELLLYGLSWDDTATVMGALSRQIRDGRRFADGEIDEEMFDRKIAFVNVAPGRYEGRIPVTIMYYEGFDFPLLQVITPDEGGRFP